MHMSLSPSLCVCVQAKLWCTSSRAKKVTTSLTLGALTFETIYSVFWRHLADVLQLGYQITSVAVRVSVPVAVLVINVVVVVQVRRAASNAAANLGVQPHHHHQSTPNNSAVPTAMLIATSIVYALVYGTVNIICLIQWRVSEGDFSLETKVVVRKYRDVAVAVGIFVFAYNFYVYLITGKHFRSQLRKLFCRCPSSFSSSAAAAAAADTAAQHS